MLSMNHSTYGSRSGSADILVRIHQVVSEARGFEKVCALRADG